MSSSDFTFGGTIQSRLANAASQPDGKVDPKTIMQDSSQDVMWLTAQSMALKKIKLFNSMAKQVNDMQ